jgi:hypothetical protein
MKQTAVEYFIEQLQEREVVFTINSVFFKELCKQAEEMEKEQSENYAEFAVECDRKDMPILEFHGYIQLKSE